jgi:hypothetical protein
MSAYEQGSWSEHIGLSHFLISAYHGIAERVRSRGFLRNSLQLIADSGGAQLKFGAADFVDPRTVIWWMNECADWGMTLDFAPRPVDQNNPKSLKELANYSLKSNKFFVANKSKSLKLCNVTHGFNLSQVREWTKRVDIEGFSGWAAGADVINNNLANLRNILVPMLECTPVSYYHLFGFSGRKKTPAMAWMGRFVNKRNGAIMASDSTSWLTLAKWRAYLTFDPSNGHIEPLAVGKRHKLKHTIHLPCSCFVCSAIGWVDYYNLPPQTYAGRALAIHNLFVLHQQTEFWNAQARSARDFKDYWEVVKWAFPHKAEVRNMVQYTEEALTHGLDSADKRFRSVLHDRAARLDMKCLFAGGATKDRDLAYVDRESALDRAERGYKDFKWNKEKPKFPFELKKRGKRHMPSVDDLNPDVIVEASMQRAAEEVGEDVTELKKKKSTSARQGAEI